MNLTKELYLLTEILTSIKSDTSEGAENLRIKILTKINLIYKILDHWSIK